MAIAGVGAADAGASLAALRAVHARLLADRSLQFDLRGMETPRPMEPEWLKALGRFLAAALKEALPILKIVFEIGIVLGVALLLYLILREIFGIRFAPRRRSRSRRTPVDWRPEAWRARALLEDADRLAAAGAFDEAAHLLLKRSIEDIDGRRPRLLRPALTARDIAALDAIPAAARTAFARIAAAVETSLFGGRALTAAAFAECRRSYEAFAFAEPWS